MVKQFPEFRRQVDDTTRRASRQRRTLSTGGTGRPSMALDSRTPTPEKGARARPCESFPRSFAGRDDASEKGYRMVVGPEKHQAQGGHHHLREFSGDSSGGESIFGRRCGSRRHRATRRPKTRDHHCSHPASGNTGAATETGTRGASVPPARILSSKP